MLLILLIFGISINGSKCWIILGPISFQPSEFMKISLIITLSEILCHDKKKSLSLKSFLQIFLILFLPSFLTFLEPDTGVVIIYFITTISMIIYRGIKKKWYLIFGIILILLGSIFFILYFFKKDLLFSFLGNNIYYRLERLFNWSNGSGYQLENSIIAIATGGLFGFGFNSIPLYFPEASTDFIFTSFATSFGFIGCLFLIGLLIIFFESILSLIKGKIKRHDKYLLIGISSMLIYQEIQNISMTIGLLPITGITLPFISYGGSSLLSYMFTMGLILNIAKKKQKYLN